MLLLVARIRLLSKSISHSQHDEVTYLLLEDFLKTMMRMRNIMDILSGCDEGFVIMIVGFLM